MDIQDTLRKLRYVGNQMIAERAKTDLYYLCKYVLGYGDVMDPKVHGPLCRALRPLLFYQNPDQALKYEYPSDYGIDEVPGIPVAEQMPTEEEKEAFWEWEAQFEPRIDDIHAVKDKLQVDLTNLLALMPRGSLKSSVITIGFTIQWHLNFSEDRVLLDSEVFNKSKAFLAEIKGHYEDNEDFRRVFYTIHGIMPNEKKRSQSPRGTDVWSTEQIVLACRRRKRKEPSIDCAGIDTTKNGMHYDIVIMDDLHSEKNTKTTEQLEQVKEHYKLVYSLLEPSHPAVVVGTRWDYNDLYQMIIDEEQDDFNFITRSAESEDGAIFYEKRLSKKELVKFRRKQGGYLYSCQYLNNPVDDETADFQRSMFEYCTVAGTASTPINWYGLIDPSWKGEKSDWAVVMIAGMDHRGNLYVRYIKRWKADYAEIAKAVFDIHAEFKPRGWLLETIATQKSIQWFLAQEQKNRKELLRIKEIRGQRKQKEERIMALQPYYDQHRVHHYRESPNIDVLENELLRFPKSKYDDVSDCFAGILEIARPATSVVLSKENSEKRKAYLRRMNKPRSALTGY